MDWFGVLADSKLMARRWRNVEARLLRNLYGGKLSTWVSVHDRAFRWYLNYWSRHGTNNRTSYRKLWRQCEIEWVKRTLTWAGIEPPASKEELFKLDRELTYEVTRRIDVAYPCARQVLRDLRRRGFRLFLVSGADSTYIKGTLEATNFGRYFERAFSPDALDVFKGSLRYWRKILRVSESDPESSVVIDDRARFLRVPARLGLRAILVGPDESPNQRFVRVRTVKELFSTDVLPNLKSNWSRSLSARVA